MVETLLLSAASICAIVILSNFVNILVSCGRLFPFFCCLLSHVLNLRLSMILLLFCLSCFRNCLQHVIFIYILVSSNWYQFRTGHSWSTPDALNQTSCGTAGKLTHDMIRRRISERIVTPYPAIS
jgi:hypothetical protein